MKLIPRKPDTRQKESEDAYRILLDTMDQERTLPVEMAQTAASNERTVLQQAGAYDGEDTRQGDPDDDQGSPEIKATFTIADNLTAKHLAKAANKVTVSNEPG